MKFKERLALSASAGSGKTFALSVRYIALLLSGANPANIVALTFTKKAAAEMRERVYRTMDELEMRESELKELCEILGKSESEVLFLRDRAMKLFLKANIKISTIDSFFGQILRKFALYLGLLPDFSARKQENRARLQKLFLQSARKSGSYSSLINFAFWSDKKLKDFFSFFDELYEKNSELGTFDFARLSSPDESGVLQKIALMKEELIKLGAHDDAIKQFDVKELSDFTKKGILERETVNYWHFKKIYTPYLDELFGEIKDEIRKFYRQKEQYWLGELFFLFERFKEAKTRLAKQSGEMSFDDITNALYSLLRENIDRDFLYFRLDGAIEHLLIDEFQDTNIVQYKILEPIIREIEAGEGTKELKSFFYVGDKKQSIYRFRGGTKALFDAVAREFAMKCESLEFNYRSDSRIVEFVNSVFKDKFDDYIEQKPKKTGGFVQVATVAEPPKGTQSSEKKEALLQEVKKAVKTLFDKGVKAHHIALLCATNKDAETIKEALLEEFDALNVQTESTSLLVNSRTVLTLMEFLKYLYFKEELFGRNFQALRGADWDELPNLEGFDRAAPPLYTVARAIRRFEIATDMDTMLFLQVCARYGDLEALLYDRIEELSINAAHEGLKVLTIHKSKGLEFECVIVCDKLGGDNHSRDFAIFDYDDLELKNIYLRASKREFVDKAYKEALDKERAFESEDRLNQLYVAFTRAQNALIVIKKEKSSFFDKLDLEDMVSGEMALLEDKAFKKALKAAQFEGKSYGRQNVKNEKEEMEGDLQSARFGEALHFCLEMMSDFTPKELDRALEFTKNRYGFEFQKEDFASIRKRVSNLITDERFLALIEGGIISKEQPYMFEGSRKQIDIMVQFADKIVIIDYKSSSYAHSSHLEQVAEYKRAIEHITQKKVEAYLCYPHERKSEIISLQNT